MSGIDHALLTRFNLPSGGAESLIRAREGWLRDRVELFERYCLPSVKAQTNKNFRWIVYFDPAGPDWLRRRIDAYDGAFFAVYRSSVSRADLLSDIRSAIGERHEDLVTSNLDNDDGLAADFVERIQGIPRPAVRSAIFCVNGLVKAGNGLFQRQDERNAFCSVRETWQDPHTCWSEWHTLLGKRMPVIELAGAPAWLQVVHDSNVSNRVQGKLTSGEPHRVAFPGLLDDVVVPTRLDLVLDRLVKHPLRCGRESVRAVVKTLALGALGKGGLDRARSFLATRGSQRT